MKHTQSLMMVGTLNWLNFSSVVADTNLSSKLEWNIDIQVYIASQQL